MTITLLKAQERINNVLTIKGYDRGEISAITRKLLEYILQVSPTKLLLLDKDTILDSEQETILSGCLEKLSKDIPLQYIIERADFYKYNLIVRDGVLIPRPETEELCELIINTIPEYSSPIRILDVGTGSGCIAFTLANELSAKDQVVAIDISDKAIDIAKENFSNILSGKADISILKSDIFNFNIDIEPFDIIVSNPPYIMVEEYDGMASNVKLSEPEIALFAPKNNPTAYYSALGMLILNGYLKQNGSLWVEINPLLCEETCKAISNSSGLDISKCEIIEDLSGKKRFIHYKNQ